MIFFQSTLFSLLLAVGASAGGLLIGAVVNSYGSKLCSVAVASVV